MITIYKYLAQFIKKDFNLNVYGLSFLFISCLIALNYQFNFEDDILDVNTKHFFGYFYYFLYYSIPYFFVIGLYWVFLPDMRERISKRFWFQSLFAIGLLSLKVWFYFHREVDLGGYNYQQRYLYYKISARILNILVYSIGIYGFYKFFEFKNTTVYGLLKKEFIWKPYFLLLALMLPLLFWASFQPDFLQTYPRLKMTIVKEDFWQWFAVFEPLYMLEFLTLEWFFRGFLVVGMVQILGRRAVLPMAMLYCLFHFGKPMGEAISSLFGGYILGVVAYYTRSIWGGVVVHMGIAFLMDALALLSHHVW